MYGKVGQSGRSVCVNSLEILCMIFFFVTQDDDVYDRYSHRWTIILLGVFIIAISAKQFVGMLSNSKFI